MQREKLPCGCHVLSQIWVDPHALIEKSPRLLPVRSSFASSKEEPPCGTSKPKMNISNRLVLFFFLFLLPWNCFSSDESLPHDKPLILVSVAAYSQIVQEVAGQDFQVRSIVPAAVSFHTYEPSPQEALNLLSATLWFRIGEPFEEKFMRVFSSQAKNLTAVDLRTNIPLIHETHCHAHGADPHIWTSPRLMKIQAVTIRDALAHRFPEKKVIFDTGCESVLKKCDDLIIDTDTMLFSEKGKIIVVAHDAYAYLCRDYQLVQLSLETGGKEPSLSKLHELISQAKEHHVKTVFSLKQYPKKGILCVAHALNATVIDLDPYGDDYFENMRRTSIAIQQATSEEL